MLSQNLGHHWKFWLSPYPISWTLNLLNSGNPKRSVRCASVLDTHYNPVLIIEVLWFWLHFFLVIHIRYSPLANLRALLYFPCCQTWQQSSQNASGNNEILWFWIILWLLWFVRGVYSGKSDRLVLFKNLVFDRKPE